MLQTGDLTHYVSRLQVKRKVPKISFIDDELSVVTLKHQKAFNESQKGLTVKKHGYQRRLEKNREHYYANRERRIKQITEYKLNNPEKAKQYDANWRKKNPDYLKNWQKENVEKARRYSRDYRREKRAKMTEQEKKQAYQDRKAKMIEKHGLDGWRAICNERSRKSRQKKKLKNESSKS